MKRHASREGLRGRRESLSLTISTPNQSQRGIETREGTSCGIASLLRKETNGIGRVPVEDLFTREKSRNGWG